MAKCLDNITLCNKILRTHFTMEWTIWFRRMSSNVSFFIFIFGCWLLLPLFHVKSCVPYGATKLQFSFSFSVVAFVVVSFAFCIILRAHTYKSIGCVGEKEKIRRHNNTAVFFVSFFFVLKLWCALFHFPNKCSVISMWQNRLTRNFSKIVFGMKAE